MTTKANRFRSLIILPTATLLLAAHTATQSGCWGTGVRWDDPPASETINAGLPAAHFAKADYAKAFVRTQDVLRELGFALDRVDAALGTLTTAPRASSGLATPWIRHAQGTNEQLDDTFNRDRRWVEVRFEETDLIADTQAGTPLMRMAVIVHAQRLYTPGKQQSPTSITLTSVTAQPELVRSGAQPGHAQAVGRDDQLGTLILNRVLKPEIHS